MIEYERDEDLLLYICLSSVKSLRRWLLGDLSGNGVGAECR